MYGIHSALSKVWRWKGARPGWSALDIFHRLTLSSTPEPLKSEDAASTVEACPPSFSNRYRVSVACFIFHFFTFFGPLFLLSCCNRIPSARPLDDTHTHIYIYKYVYPPPSKKKEKGYCIWEMKGRKGSATSSTRHRSPQFVQHGADRYTSPMNSIHCIPTRDRKLLKILL